MIYILGQEQPEKRYKEAKRKYVTKEREKVFSKGELEIADFLHDHEIGYHYESQRVIEGQQWFPDFYLYKQDVYIEFEGMIDEEASRKRYAARYMAFKNAGYEVIQLYPSQQGRLGEVILEKLKELNKDL